MNPLSWIIYLLGVVTILHTIFAAIIVFSILILIIGCFLIVMYKIFLLFDSYESEMSKDIYNKIIYILKKSFIVLLILESLEIILPSRQTFILIAASEIGQRIIASEKGASIIDPSYELLEIYIRKETLSLKKEMNSSIEGNK